MTAHAATTQRLVLQVHDRTGQAYAILLEVEERAATGRLMITPHNSQQAQEHTLTQMQKSHDGKTLTCTVGAATATLTIEDSIMPPALRLVARLFVPILDVTYTLREADQQRLVAWIKTLTVVTLS